MSQEYDKLRYQYGSNFTKILYEGIEKSFFDEISKTPDTHITACKIAGLTMVLIKLDLVEKT